jgi:hypothetical protein
MTASGQLFASGILAPDGSVTAQPNWIASIGPPLAALAKSCTDDWEAAPAYEQLAALSNAELTRGGLSPATLSREVGAPNDRSGDA